MRHPRLVPLRWEILLLVRVPQSAGLRLLLLVRSGHPDDPSALACLLSLRGPPHRFGGIAAGHFSLLHV
jgi:hypothetical protein